MPPMALAEAQVVILYFFWIKYNYIDQSKQIHLVLVDVIKENIHPLFKRTTRISNWIFGKITLLRYHFKLELKTSLTEYIIHDSSIYTSDSHWQVNQSYDRSRLVHNKYE